VKPLRRAWVRLLRFGYRLLYNELAWTYDLVSRLVSFGEWRAWGRSGVKHLNIQPGSAARLLEVAHGTGNIHLDLRAMGFHVVGLDLSRAMGRITARKLRRLGFAPQLVRADVFVLPFPAGVFDAILSTFPTNFITEPAMIAESYRVLKPGGRLVFVPNALFTRADAATLTLEALYRATGQRRSELADDLWMTRFTDAGFGLRHVIEPHRRSASVVFIAEKLH